jgi:hypothetical protein
MSAEKLIETRDPALLAGLDCAERPLTCGILGSRRYCGKDCQKLHWKSGHKISLQAQ